MSHVPLITGDEYAALLGKLRALNRIPAAHCKIVGDLWNYAGIWHGFTRDQARVINDLFTQFKAGWPNRTRDHQANAARANQNCARHREHRNRAIPIA